MRQSGGDYWVVVPLAPRYSQRIFDLVRALDDADEPMAETCRRVGRAAQQIGLPKPSYSHLRRFIKEEREHRAAIAEVVREVTSDVLAARVPHPDHLERLLDRAG